MGPGVGKRQKGNEALSSARSVASSVDLQARPLPEPPDCTNVFLDLSRPIGAWLNKWSLAEQPALRALCAVAAQTKKFPQMGEGRMGKEGSPNGAWSAVAPLFRSTRRWRYGSGFTTAHAHVSDLAAKAVHQAQSVTHAGIRNLHDAIRTANIIVLHKASDFDGDLATATETASAGTG